MFRAAVEDLGEFAVRDPSSNGHVEEFGRLVKSRKLSQMSGGRGW